MMNLIPNENIVIDHENNKIILNSSSHLDLNTISSALFGFSDDNYLLLDKDIIQGGFIITLIPKIRLNKDDLKLLSSDVVSQLNVYDIHKNKLNDKKEFVDFIMQLISNTNKTNDENDKDK